ncbi:Golgi to endosome transport [Coemansia linderi]|uniref:Golgi to endosome transport n=1 Tax=Coemansia linderi TaxID=2663919 RepID=A0ACC1JSR6_9FUNG|nr:Golgi to endosome transport [Coemansia linderi]
MVAVYNYGYVAKLIIIGDMGCGKSSLLRQFTEDTFVKRFRSVTRSYYRGSIGTIFVYDITNRESFESLDKWMVDARQLTAPHSIFVLVGNKADQESRRVVSVAEGEKYARQNDMLFVEASAKTGEKVDSTFLTLASRIVQLVKDGIVDPMAPDSGVQSKKPQDALAAASAVAVAKNNPRAVQVNSEASSRFSFGMGGCC